MFCADLLPFCNEAVNPSIRGAVNLRHQGLGEAWDSLSPGK